MTQTELAAALGVRERTISRWESEINQPEVRYLRKLAQILECSLVWLLGGEPNGDETPTEVAA